MITGVSPLPCAIGSTNIECGDSATFVSSDGQTHHDRLEHSSSG